VHPFCKAGRERIGDRLVIQLPNSLTHPGPCTLWENILKLNSNYKSINDYQVSDAGFVSLWSVKDHMGKWIKLLLKNIDNNQVSNTVYVILLS
jgi:hypothetical protein